MDAVIVGDTTTTTLVTCRQPSEEEDREEALAAGGFDLLVVPGLAFTRQTLNYFHYYFCK